jgi:AbrB family looped-hinge helix DNA binding protein
LLYEPSPEADEGRASEFRIESLLSPFVTVRPQLWIQRATTHHCGVRARVTRKGQITIPKQIRDRLGLRPGDDLDVVAEGGMIAIRKRVGSKPFARFRGYLRGHAGKNADQLVEELRGA